MTSVKKPRVLFIDIESSPITGYSWETYQANVLKILEPSKVLSVAWKWLGEDEVFCKTIQDYKGYKKNVIDDEKLIKDVWKVLDECDILIGHYASKFDVPKLNGRFLYYGLNAPSAYQVIDTKKVASKHFKLDSNSLNNIAEYLGLGSKVENGGFSLWTKCIAGDKESWSLMAEYNRMDVILLERVYMKLRPFITNHPSLSLISGAADGETCPSCQSSNVQRRGFSFTRTGRKQRYQCSDCGSWSQGSFERVKNNLLFGDDE